MDTGIPLLHPPSIFKSRSGHSSVFARSSGQKASEGGMISQITSFWRLLNVFPSRKKINLMISLIFNGPSDRVDLD